MVGGVEVEGVVVHVVRGRLVLGVGGRARRRRGPHARRRVRKIWPAGLAPVAPVTPVAPVVPAPVTPTAPVRPVTPVTPATPVSPEPVRPTGPVTPFVPAVPVTPVMPGTPCGPVAPVRPLVPAVPVAPECPCPVARRPSGPEPCSGHPGPVSLDAGSGVADAARHARDAGGAREAVGAARREGDRGVAGGRRERVARADVGHAELAVAGGAW